MNANTMEELVEQLAERLKRFGIEPVFVARNGRSNETIRHGRAMRGTV